MCMESNKTVQICANQFEHFSVFWSEMNLQNLHLSNAVKGSLQKKKIKSVDFFHTGGGQPQIHTFL